MSLVVTPFKVYITGPSAELLRTEPGEAQIEKLIASAVDYGFDLVVNWPWVLRQFFARMHQTGLDYDLDYDQSMRHDFAGIVEADAVIHALIDGAPSQGQSFEAGVGAFLSKPTYILCPCDPTQAQRTFLQHPFFRLCPTTLITLQDGWQAKIEADLVDMYTRRNIPWK